MKLYPFVVVLIYVLALAKPCLPEENLVRLTTPPELSLRDAAALALTNSPALAAFEWKVRAAEARILQAGLRPNPELSLEVEDIRFSRAPDGYAHSTTVRADGAGLSATQDRSRDRATSAGFSDTQLTLRLSQLVELGGKRIKRIQFAEREKATAQWDYETARLDVLTEVAKGFVTVLGAQKRIELLEHEAQVAEQVAMTVSERVKAGKVSPIEVTRAETQQVVARIAADKATRELAVARAGLAETWDSKTPDFDHVVGDFEAVEAVAPFEELVQHISRNPDVTRWADEMESRQAALAVERSMRISDVTLSVGFRNRGLPFPSQSGRSSESSGAVSWTAGNAGSTADRENLLVAGISLPLPVFNRNQGKIKEAECEAARAKEEQRGAGTHAHATLYAAYQRLSDFHDAVMALRNEVLPRAKDAFERTQEGYRQGKFGYLEVLDAQRTQLEANAQDLDALTGYHQAVAEVERLIGEPVTGMDAGPRKENEDHGQP